MSMNRQLVSAILLMSLCAPAVQADLVADPNEFKQLKKLTGFDKQKNNNGKNVNTAPKLKDEKKQAGDKTTEKTVKVKAKVDEKAKSK